MQTGRVVVPPPAFCQDLRLLERMTPLAGEKLFLHLPIERFGIGSLPRGPWLDIERCHLKRVQPLSELARDELRPIIRPNMRRDPATQKQIRQDQQHVWRADPAGYHRDQTLACLRVENLENSKGPAVVRPIRHEVIRPDVIAICGPQPKARPIVSRIPPPTGNGV